MSVRVEASSDSRHLTLLGKFRYQCVGVLQGEVDVSVQNDRVLDTVMLERLAVIAAANERTLVEELNCAVRTYVMNELVEQSQLRLIEQAVANERDVFAP